MSTQELSPEDKKIWNGMKIGIFIFVLVIALFNLPIVTIPAGNRGVVTRFGAVTGAIKGEGMSFKAPFIEKVTKMNVQVNLKSVTLAAASADTQQVTSKISVNYHVDPNRVADVYQKIGMDYVQKILEPSIAESLKNATAKFTAVEAVTKRDEMSNLFKTNLLAKVLGTGIIIDAVNIEDVDFSPSFNKAIEEKVTAEQNALASKNKLEQTKYEAEQRIAQAKGEAEAIKIQSEAINSQGGASYVNMKAVEKWDGKLPTNFVPGSAMPFIQLPSYN
jgi:regulator of protease activity HflC (stomatin/prohibitin superfamily)